MSTTRTPSHIAATVHRLAGGLFAQRAANQAPDLSGFSQAELLAVWVQFRPNRRRAPPRRAGQAAPGAKLTNDQVDQLLTLYEKGQALTVQERSAAGLTVRQLAQRFGISAGSCGDICSGRRRGEGADTWRRNVGLPEYAVLPPRSDGRE
jgi:hypothetical protein